MPPEHRVLVALWYLLTQTYYRTIAETQVPTILETMLIHVLLHHSIHLLTLNTARCCIKQSMAFDSVTQVCLAVLELEEHYAIWPSDEQLQAEEAKFFSICGEQSFCDLPHSPLLSTGLGNDLHFLSIVVGSCPAYIHCMMFKAGAAVLDMMHASFVH